MEKETIASIIFLALLVLVPAFLITGWILNIIQFAKLDFKQPYKAEIIRGIGITPVGAIIGWIKIEDN